MLIAINRLVAEFPIPYPFPSMSSSNIIIKDAKVSWSTIKIAFPAPIADKSPYIPDQVYANPWPNAIKTPTNFCAPSYNYFYYRMLWSTFINLAPDSNCMIIDAVTIGEIPSSINVPRLEARIALIQ